MARFKKHESGNPAGRPKGAKNKIVPFTKQEINTFLSEYWPQIKKDFRQLEPAARIQQFMKLMSFVMPQPKENNVSIDFRQLSDEALDQVVNRILGENENT